MKKLILALLITISYACSFARAQQQTGAYFLTVADMRNVQEQARLVESLTKAGYRCRSIPDSPDTGIVHIQVGPYSTESALAKVRADFIAAGYQLPSLSSGISATSSEPSDIEARALAHLGGGPTPSQAANGAELEARALDAMKANEEEASRQRQLQQQRADEERQEQERRQEQEASDPGYQAAIAANRAAAQAQASSSGGGFLSTLNSVLGAVNDQMAQDNAQAAARNAERQAQMNAQVAANEARRQQEAAQAQTRATQQAEARQQQAAQSRSTYTIKPTSTQAPGGAYGPSTGNAAPATCVDLGPDQPCMPLADYQRLQAQKAQTAKLPIVSSPQPEVACLYNANVPPPTTGPCANGAPNSHQPAAGSGIGPGSGYNSGAVSGFGLGLGNGSSNGSTGEYGPLVYGCVFVVAKNGQQAFFNDCGQQVHVLFYASGTIYGGLYADAGATISSGYSSEQITGAGGWSYYSCTTGYSPVDSGGVFVGQRKFNGTYRCKK